jgi:hypothetical protein
MKAQHPFDMLREHQNILFPALFKHMFCTLIGLLAVIVWLLYAVAWAVGFLWEFFTDPLLKANTLEVILNLLHRLCLLTRTDLEHNSVLSPVYTYLQRSLDNELLSVLDSEDIEENKDMTPTEPTPYDTNPEDIVELDEMTYPTEEDEQFVTRPIWEDNVPTTYPTPTSDHDLFGEGFGKLDARALDDSLDFHG